MKPQLILVSVEQSETGAYHASSLDMPGLHTFEYSWEALLNQVPLIIAALFETSRQQKIIVQPVDYPSKTVLIYVAVPAEGQLDLCA